MTQIIGDTADTDFPRPIIIVGAGRSGTNMLRDILCRLQDFGTWPCDEINYIWRYGNSKEPTDALKPTHARPQVRRYIRGAFRSIARRRGVKNVVEKTCANSLRLRFVNEVVPEAVYIHVVRDGRDVVASAMKRWISEMDLSYIFRKARYVPVPDVPRYALRYLRDRLDRYVSSEKRIGFWGPRFEGYQDARRRPLHELCAVQWSRCVLRASEDLTLFAPERTFYVRYENFVQQPVSHLSEMCAFLGLRTEGIDFQQLVMDVSPRSVGKWKSELSEAQVASIASELEAVESIVARNAPA